MEKPELLAPAKDMDTLKMAINCGADAVYVGGKEFSARAFAVNFDKQQLKEATEYCHLYGVKIYVAVNTIIFENEIEKCLNYLKHLYEINVDAVIMQDIGMISLTRKLIPNLEIHASTQINCHNKNCLKFLKKLGIKRVVLAREMDIESIKDLNKIIDIEIFIHGALCVSYSGRCLFSSLNGGRSGNRGRCTGSCRLPYEVFDKDKKLNIKYPLSTKELCTIQNIEEILKLNVKSLKIEGRMKSKEYVGYVTKVYRRLIDEYFEKKKIKLEKETLINLSKLYNRKFTTGYLFNDNIYNTSSSNHLGYPLGKVIKTTPKKIYIKLSDDLNMEDAVRFTKSNLGMIANKIYDENGLLTKNVKKGKMAIIDNKINLKTTDYVNKTIDKELLKEINKIKPKKIKINFTLTGYINKPLMLEISDGKNIIKKSSIILDESKNIKMTKEMIEKKLSKISNTPFETANVKIDIENVFIPLKYLNKLKHQLIESLIEVRSKKSNKVDFKYEKKETNYKSNKTNYFIQNKQDITKLKGKYNILYTDNYKLYKKYNDLNIYYRLPNIMENFPNYKNERLLINDLGSLYKYYKDNDIITDYTLNVANSESVKLLEKYKVKLITLSPELRDYEILKYTKNTEIIIKGKLELMVIKNFPLKGDIYLKDKYKNTFKVINKKYTTILHHESINIKEKIETNKRIIL